jgi:YD repeat-containing protein
MKKLQLLFILWFVSCSNLFAQDSSFYKIGWTPKHLYKKAKITQEGIYNYKIKEGFPVDSSLFQVNFYDTSGNLIKLQSYRANKLSERITYYYTTTILDSSKEELFTLPATIIQQYTYDSFGNLILQNTLGVGRQHTVENKYYYNSRTQLLQIYTRYGSEELFLSGNYQYNYTNLIDRIDFLFDKKNKENNYSYIYEYADSSRTATRYLLSWKGKEKLLDCTRIYDEKSRLIKKISPYVEKQIVPRKSEVKLGDTVEEFIYYPNGTLYEWKTTLNNKLLRLQRHFCY